jgi:uncharacterized protein (DUF58 family)
MKTNQHPLGRLGDSARFRLWLNRRVPPQNKITLKLRNIFILPSRQGLFFSLLMILILIAGINYQNSLAHGLAFLLMSLFMVSMLHTYRNLSGLVFSAGRGGRAFSGDEGDFSVTLSCAAGRDHEAVQVYWGDHPVTHADLIDKSVITLRVSTIAGNRGWFDPGRLTVETRFPLGLFRAWALLDLDFRALVYPRPIAENRPPTLDEGDSDDFHPAGAHSDDFAGVRDYLPGDLVRDISWKATARLGELMTKEYTASSGSEKWLDWYQYEQVPDERRLSHLAYWVEEFSKQGMPFGLRLPSSEIAPDLGENHRQQMLRALALYGLDQA